MDCLDYFDRIELFESLYPTPDSDHLGKSCLDKSKLKSKLTQDYNPLYGEIKRSGLITLLSQLEEKDTKIDSFTDLGCGIGKIIILVFLFYPDIRNINGIELCQERFEKAKKVILELFSYINNNTNQTNQEVSFTCQSSSKKIQLSIQNQKIITNTLTLEHQNLYLYNMNNLNSTDVKNSKHCSIFLADFAFLDQKVHDDCEHLLEWMKKQKEGSIFILY